MVFSNSSIINIQEKTLFLSVWKKNEDTTMIYLILVSILGINPTEVKTDILEKQIIEFTAHNNKTIGHDGIIKYTKAPTSWVKLINN